MSDHETMQGASFRDIEARLRECLSRQVPQRLGDLDARVGETPDGKLRPAAVLVLLERAPGYNVILTKRTQDVEHHKGEISLAGGMADPSDRDATATALREAHEELGIAPADVDVLGCLDQLVTVTRFLVRPVVAAVRADYPLAPHDAEVERVLHVPLRVLRDPANWFEDVRSWQGREYRLRSCRYGDDVIWGATSRILQHFLSIVPASIL